MYFTLNNFVLSENIIPNVLSTFATHDDKKVLYFLNELFLLYVILLNLRYSVKKILSHTLNGLCCDSLYQ